MDLIMEALLVVVVMVVATTTTLEWGHDTMGTGTGMR
jgi:hypothetical protein